MKNKLIIILLILCMMVIPFRANAKELSNITLNLRETLADEGIEESFSDYSENDDQITIYMFRGKGCGYCRKFLEFLNSITDEYGKYYKLVAFEVWNDSENNSLMEEVSEYLEEPAEGVPYIIIGDKIFTGYAESYNNQIKDAITSLYNTEKSERYDVFDKMDLKEDKEDTKKESSSMSNKVIIILDLVIILVGAISLIGYNSYKFKQYDLKIEELEKKITKTTKTKKK